MNLKSESPPSAVVPTVGNADVAPCYGGRVVTSTFKKFILQVVRTEGSPSPRPSTAIELRQWAINSEELSPSPLRSGGEGRGEEAPSDLIATSPSPHALSPLRCAGRGRRPANPLAKWLNSIAVPRPSPPGERDPRTRGWFPLLGERVGVRAEYYLPRHRLLGENFFLGTARKVAGAYSYQSGVR